MNETTYETLPTVQEQQETTAQETIEMARKKTEDAPAFVPDAEQKTPAKKPSGKKSKGKKKPAAADPQPESVPTTPPEPKKTPGRKRKPVPTPEPETTPEQPTPEPEKTPADEMPEAERVPVDPMPTPEEPDPMPVPVQEKPAEINGAADVLDSIPAAAIVTIPERVLGPALLRQRSWEGLRPVHLPKTPASGQPCAVGLPASASREDVLEWLEKLLNWYEAEQLWLTNGGLRFWRGWLIIGGKICKSPAEYLQVQDTINAAIAGRDEPREWDADVRSRVWLAIHQRSSSGPGGRSVVAAENKVDLGEAGNGANATATVRNGPKGRPSYKFEFAGTSLSVTAAIRYMGATGWTLAQINTALGKLGFAGMAESTKLAHYYCGRQHKPGDKGRIGTIPSLTEAQDAALVALRND